MLRRSQIGFFFSVLIAFLFFSFFSYPPPPPFSFFFVTLLLLRSFACSLLPQAFVRVRNFFFLCPVLICRIFFPIPFGSTTYLPPCPPSLSSVPFSSVLCVKTQPIFFSSFFLFFIIFPGLPYSKKNVLPFLAKDSAAALDRLSRKKNYKEKKIIMKKKKVKNFGFAVVSSST